MTAAEHWNSVWSKPPRMRLPSGLHVTTRSLQRLLAAHVSPGMKVLEIGCAPGKLLSWVAARLHAEVCGVDYSERGMQYARQLFQCLRLQADLRHEDIFETSFDDGRFDLVYSAGVIEHFHDPRAIVARHVALTRPGGKVVITIPNYGGWYGSLEGYLHPENLGIHNLQIMNCVDLAKLAPPGVSSARAYPFGRLSPWFVSLDRLLPSPLALLTNWSLNALGLLQPCDIACLCPMLVLEVAC